MSVIPILDTKGKLQFSKNVTTMALPVTPNYDYLIQFSSSNFYVGEVERNSNRLGATEEKRLSPLLCTFCDARIARGNDDKGTPRRSSASATLQVIKSCFT
jgi:hypothetical protein